MIAKNYSFHYSVLRAKHSWYSSPHGEVLCRLFLHHCQRTLSIYTCIKYGIFIIYACDYEGYHYVYVPLAVLTIDNNMYVPASSINKHLFCVSAIENMQLSAVVCACVFKRLQKLPFSLVCAVCKAFSIFITARRWMLMFAEIANITSNIVSSAVASFPPLCLFEQLNCLGVPAIC